MEIQELITDLPPWLQLIILAVVVVLGTLLGKRGQKKYQQKPTLKAPRKAPAQKHRVYDLNDAQIKSLKIMYDPKIDGDPDPGEVVWVWVPFVEYDGRGKDRPVLIISRLDSGRVAGCYMSTKEHYGFIEVGSGPWDGKGRPSFLSPERVLSIPHGEIRREGSIIPKKQFTRVTEQLSRHF